MEPTVLEKPTYDELAAENARLSTEAAALLAAVAELREQLAAALAEIDRLKRSGKRQATPFSKGSGVAKPKKPGRKRGEGLFRRREAPAPESYTEQIPVPVTRTDCPGCGGALVPGKTETVTRTDLPPAVRLDVTAYHVGTCQCADCGKKVRGTHPDLPADQFGATAHRVGERMLALGHWLHYRIGVPVRKVPAILTAIYGNGVTQGALTQDALRRARGKVGEAYTKLRKEVAEAPAVHTDDTGWKVGGRVAFLMGFFTKLVSFFQIRPRHRNDEVREVIPSVYPGVLITDRGPSYDAKTLAAVKKQKCVPHLQRSLTEALEGRVPGERLVGRGRSFCLRVKQLLREASALWEAYHTGTAENYGVERDRLQREMTHVLRHRPIQGAANVRLLSELGWHHDQGSLLRFLHEPDTVEPTNNRAERELRPAVIARKVSHCSKTWAGAQAHAAFMSVICTLRKRRVSDPLDALVQVFRTGRLPE